MIGSGYPGPGPATALHRLLSFLADLSTLRTCRGDGEDWLLVESKAHVGCQRLQVFVQRQVLDKNQPRALARLPCEPTTQQSIFKRSVDPIPA